MAKPSQAKERFVVRFNRETGMLHLVEALRWGTLIGNATVTVAAVTWLDEGTPWAVFKIEEVVQDRPSSNSPV